MAPDALIAVNTSCTVPQAPHAKRDLAGTVPPALPVLKRWPVSGQVTSSGSAPRTSSSRRRAARAPFHRTVDAASSATEPP